MLPSPVVVYCFVFTGGGGVTTVIDQVCQLTFLAFSRVNLALAVSSPIKWYIHPRRYQTWSESKQNSNWFYLGFKEALSVLMLCTPSSRWQPFSYHSYHIFVFCPFSRGKKTHKLRKVYWIWQVATIRSINYDVSALKELSCQHRRAKH